MTYDPSDTNENDNTADGDVTFESVSTDSASIANAPTGNNDALRWEEGVEVGTVSSSTTIQSSNDDFSDSDTAVVSVTFDSAFANTPDVVVSVDTGNTDFGPKIFARKQNVSTTGFDMVFINYSSDSSSNQEANYVATEGR